MIRTFAPAVVAALLLSSVAALPASAVQETPIVAASPSGPPSPVPKPGSRANPRAPGNPGDSANPGGPSRSTNGWQDDLCRRLPWFCR